MRHRLDLPTVLVRVRDVDGDSATVSTDGHHIRLVLRDARDPATGWRYIDLDTTGAAALARGVAAPAQPHPTRARSRWMTARRRR